VMKTDIMAKHAAWRAVVVPAQTTVLDPVVTSFARRLRVLIIADGAVRTQLLESLWLDGHEIVTAGGDEEARRIAWSIANDAMKPPDVIVVVLGGRLAGALHQETLVRLQEHSPRSAFVLVAAPDDYLAQVAATRLDALLVRAPVNLDDLRILI